MSRLPLGVSVRSKSSARAVNIRCRRVEHRVHISVAVGVFVYRLFSPPRHPSALCVTMSSEERRASANEPPKENTWLDQLLGICEPGCPSARGAKSETSVKMPLPASSPKARSGTIVKTDNRFGRGVSLPGPSSPKVQHVRTGGSGSRDREGGGRQGVCKQVPLTSAQRNPGPALSDPATLNSWPIWRWNPWARTRKAPDRAWETAARRRGVAARRMQGTVLD